MYETQKICINCGRTIKSLFKKYSDTVLKLTDCEFCHEVADKYVEYDIVIIIIDLVLLQKAAYRHVLFNIDFRNFWKLAVILLLMEAYSELMKKLPMENLSDNEEEKLFLNEFNQMTDYLFYQLSLKVAFKSIVFLLVLYIFTKIYCKFNTVQVSFISLWRAITVSSFGTFLLLPSLIWDTDLQELHLGVVSLYTTLSQLLAYTALCNCHKLWSIIAIFSAYYCKIFCLELLE